MGSFFSLEGGLFAGMSKLFDMLFLSVLWVIGCIPIVTIGASTTALYYTTAKVIRKERGYVAGEFWRSFKSNFLTSVIYTVILLLFSAVMVFNLMYIRDNKNGFNNFLSYVYILLSYLAYSITVYLFPVLSRFKMGRSRMLKFSLFLSMKHLPTTLLLQIVVVCFAFLIWIMPPTAFILPAVGAYFCSLSIEKVFKKYMPVPEDADPDTLDWFYTF